MHTACIKLDIRQKLAIYIYIYSYIYIYIAMGAAIDNIYHTRYILSMVLPTYKGAWVKFQGVIIKVATICR